MEFARARGGYVPFLHGGVHSYSAPEIWCSLWCLSFSCGPTDNVAKNAQWPFRGGRESLVATPSGLIDLTETPLLWILDMAVVRYSNLRGAS